MVPTLKILFPILVVILCSYGCGESTNASAKLSEQQPELGINLDSIIDFENSKNEWKRSNIHVTSRIQSDSSSEFDQYPIVEEAESNSFVLRYLWEPEAFVSHHDLYIEVKDSSKIKLNEVYQIPHDNIKLRIVYKGMGSNFELFKKVKGTLRFSTIQKDYVKIEVDLVGDLSEMIQKQNAEIFKGELNILKDYSCYRGYAPENKLNINLDSIRELESVKNNDYNQTNIVTRARIIEHAYKESAGNIMYTIDSTLINSILLSNSWRPIAGNHQSVYIEISDTSKIKLGKEYSLPNSLFEIHTNLFVNNENILYENLSGTIRFNHLHEDYTEVKLFLKGDGGINKNAKDVIILDDMLYLLKGFAWRQDF